MEGHALSVIGQHGIKIKLHNLNYLNIDQILMSKLLEEFVQFLPLNIQ